MLKNYLKITLRSLRRRKGYAALNIAGLAVGMACCVLIGLYVRHELSYDRFHANADRLYRVAQTKPMGAMAGTGAALGPALAEDFPQIEAAMRFIRNDKRVAVEHPETGEVRRFEEEGFVYADPAVLEAFPFPLVQGDAASALARPGTVILTEETARRYFGDADPMGRTLRLEGGGEPFPLTVAGVVEDVPNASHLSFDLLTGYDTFKAEQGIPVEQQFTSYWWPWGWTYVLLEDGADAEALEALLGGFAERRRGDRTFVPFLQPITRIHLYSDLSGEWEANGSAQVVGVFAAIALFVLLLAGVNFVNLATARAAERAREVGVRKAVGAGRGQVARQFLGEALLLTGVALALALVIARAGLPAFNALAGTSLSLPYGAPVFWGALLGVFLLVGLGAGGYPALVLSGFDPARVLKGSASGRSAAGGARLRKGLVVFQFTVSVALIAATAVAFQQLQYLRAAPLGFDEARVAALDLKATAPARPLKEALLRQPGIEAVSFASQRPGFGANAEVPFETEEDRSYTPSDQIAPEDESAANRTRYQNVSAGYFSLMDIPVLAGREFSDARPADLGEMLRDEEHAGPFFRGRAKILNRAAVEALGWTPEEVIGKTFRMYTSEGGTLYMDTQGPIIGVVENVHTSSMREEIVPMVYEPAGVPGSNGTYGLNYALVKLAPGSAAGAMDALEAAWDAVVPEVPFEASFLDEALDNRYEREQRLGQVFAVFALVAIFVACLGLFGLAAYTAQQRTKEIGIRKALGASAASIVGLLSKDFLGLVAVAVVLAAPVAYLGMSRWLEGFAYRIALGPGVFLAAGAAALLIALLTVSYQALKAARTDPTKALRSE